MSSAPDDIRLDVVPETTIAPPSLNVPQLIWRHKSLVALGAVIGLILGVLFWAQMTPTYQSSAQVMVIKKQSNTMPTGDQDPRAFYYEDYLVTHQVLLRSPLIVSRAITKHNLTNLPSLRGASNPTGSIREHLTVQRDGKEGATPGTGASVLDLDFRTTSAEDCATVLSAIMDVYKDFLDEKYKNVSDATLRQTVQAMESLQRDLVQRKKEYVEFQKNSPLLYLKTLEGVAPQEDWLLQIQSQRMALFLQRAELKRKLEDIETAVKDGRGRQAMLAQLLASRTNSTTTGSNPDRRLDEQMFDLQMKEQMLRAEYGPEHPDAVSIRQRMALTRDFFTKRTIGGPAASDTDLSDPVTWRIYSLRQELSDIDIKLKSLDDMYATELKDVRDMSNFKLEDRRLREEIARMQLLFEPIIRRLEEIKLVRDLGGFDAEVITPPMVGKQKGAGFIQIVLVGGLLGALLGVGGGYVAEVTDKTFRNPEDIRRRLQATVVGHVPELRPDPAATANVAEGSPDPFLVAHYQPKSLQAESFRGLRTSLYFTTRGETHKIIQVTSPTKGDGKSTLTANLAVCIAQSGKKVLLIDADLRKPRQHKIFGIKADMGLASVIADQTEWKDAVQPTAVPGLSLLPSGKLPSNPAELVTSHRFKELLEVVRSEYDFILVDTPPLLAVSDPSIVAPQVDGVLLVLRIVKNGRPAAERCREVLVTLGANLLGVVVNGYSNQTGPGYGAYGYGYDSGAYGYGYAYDNRYGYSYQGDYYEEEVKTTAPADGNTAVVPAPVEGASTGSPEQKRRTRRHRRGSTRPLVSRLLSWWQSR